jgi:hypothetical protein
MSEFFQMEDDDEAFCAGDEEINWSQVDVLAQRIEEVLAIEDDEKRRAAAAALQEELAGD